MTPPHEPNGAQQLHTEMLALINRYMHEADISICEAIGVMRLVEEDILEKLRQLNRQV
jgi:nucleoside-triphosphatase THEP1